MIFYSLIFVLLRTFVQFVHDDYEKNAQHCKTVLQKALAETMPDIQSAYFLKVMEADNSALQKTFDKYYIGFLASNTTYASQEEIATHACHMSTATTEFLSWTAGVTPIFSLWIVYMLFLKSKTNTMQKNVAPPQEDAAPAHVKKTIELTKPPITVQRNPPKSNPDGIRRRPKKENEPSVLQQLTSLSPRLKNRLMGKEVDV